MPTKTIAELKALVDTRLPTNNAGAIDAATLRSVIDDILDNEQVALAGILTSAGTPSSTTFLRGDNTWAPPASSGTFSGTGDPGLTRAQAAATTFTSPPNAIRTTGYDTTDDNGGGLYVKVTSQPEHAGKFQTVDGTWYELKHEGGKVWAAQFGSKANPPNLWNARANDISDFLNAAVDYAVFNRFGLCDVHIHGGNYYMTKTVQLKGGSFNVRGVGKSGTFIMPAEYVTAFVAHHPSYSFEAFGGGYGWRQYEVNETWFTPNGTPGTASAHAYICTVAGVTSSDGSQKPTGTGTGYVDGTAHFDYYREATRVELTGQGWSGELSNLSLYSHFDGSRTNVPGTGAYTAQINAPAVGPWPQFSSGESYPTPWKPSFGFLGRVRAHIHHVDMSGFSAHGCAFMANGDFDFPTVTGNVNFWCVTDSSFYYNAMDGLHVSYSDGNAGYASHIDVAGNGRWGIRDQSFLGNMYVQVQSATDGRNSLTPNKRFPSSVAFGGNRYHARLGRIGVSATPNWGATAPSGTNASNAAWQYASSGGTDGWDYPDWVSGAHYEPSGCYGSDNINARNLWNSCYIEGGTNPAQFNGSDVIIGGLMQNTFIGTGQNLLNDGLWYQPVNTTSRARPWGTSLGSGGTYGDNNEGILLWNDGVNEYSLRTDSYENSSATWATDNFCWAIGRGVQSWIIRSGQLQKYFGRSTQSAVPAGGWAFRYLFAGSDGDCRQIDFMDSVPTSGTWAQGDKVYKRNASIGQPEGWVCTVGGTPGTWRALANIA